MIPDQFQLELQALLKKYGKEIRVSISPMIVDVPKDNEPAPELIAAAKKTLKKKGTP